MKYQSLWLEDKSKRKYPSLKNNLNVDILIIGGGITGLSTAYFLRNKGYKIALVERDKIGIGASGRNTGKITYLQGTIYADLCNMYNDEVAKEYLYSQDLAISLIRNIILDEKIKCNLEKSKSYVFTENDEEIEKIKEEKIFLESIGLDVYENVNEEEKIKCKYIIGVDNTYTFNPVKYLDQLAIICKKSKIKIFEKTKIIKIIKNDGYICKTDKGLKIKCNKLILACHYPYFLKPYFMPLKVNIEKSYLGAAIVDKVKNKSYITSAYPYKSLRYYKDKEKYLIYLTNSHIICDNLDEKRNFKQMLKEIDDLDINLSYYWSNDDLMTVDGMPYIGRLEKNNDNLFIGTGYNTWGNTNGTLAGYCLCKLVLNEECEYEKIFDPLRVNKLSYIGKIIVNSYYNMKGYIENKLIKNKYWYNKNVSYEVINNKNVAIYKDGDKEYIVYSKCPHLGCTLIFNEIDKTWDCPCHASRFNLEGKCIKGPSNYDIAYNEEDEEDEL